MPMINRRWSWSLPSVYRGFCLSVRTGDLNAGLCSHDLLEGIFARAGLASDIEVVEEFPSRYDAAAARQHRWARGDWQLLPWVFGRGQMTARPIRCASFWMT